jgi:3-dehydroquinate synthase
MNDLLARSADALSYIIERSCHHKAEIVRLDERETGLRALLNLGHTFAHAIEAGMGYGEWLHGEAVATGMVMAADLSHRLGWLINSDVERISSLLLQARLPIRFPQSLSNSDLMQLMSVDKKVQNNRLRFILLEALGKGIITDDIASEKVHATLNACRSTNQYGDLRS